MLQKVLAKRAEAFFENRGYEKGFDLGKPFSKTIHVCFGRFLIPFVSNHHTGLVNESLIIISQFLLEMLEVIAGVTLIGALPYPKEKEVPYSVRRAAGSGDQAHGFQQLPQSNQARRPW